MKPVLNTNISVANKPIWLPIEKSSTKSSSVKSDIKRRIGIASSKTVVINGYGDRNIKNKQSHECPNALVGSIFFVGYSMLQCKKKGDACWMGCQCGRQTC